MPNAPTNLTKSKPASFSLKSPHASRFTPAALKAFRVNVRVLRAVAEGRMPCSTCQGPGGGESRKREEEGRGEEKGRSRRVFRVNHSYRHVRLKFLKLAQGSQYVAIVLVV